VALLTAELGGDESSELERQRAAVRVRRWVGPDGMRHSDIALDPVRDEIFWNAVNRSLSRLRRRSGTAATPWNQLQVEALLDAVGGTGTDSGAHVAPPESVAAEIARHAATAVDRATARHAGTATAAESSSQHDPAPPDSEADPTVDNRVEHVPERCRCDAELRNIEQRVPEMSVLVDLETLLHGLHDRSIAETENGVPVPVATIRRWCCDAEILPIVMNGSGEVLDVGRSKRTLNRAQRRALRAMHRTCAHPECTVPFADTKAHHVRWWWRDLGPTDIANLIPLCERHHHLVHEGGWTLTMTADRIATWIRPDGTVHHRGSCIDRQPTPTARSPHGPTTSSPPPERGTRATECPLDTYHRPDG
jgi:hypothetical protein